MSNSLEKPLATVAKGASIIFTGIIIGRALGAVNQILLARVLGPYEYGLFSIGLSLIGIVSAFAIFGLVGALPRFIPFNRERERNDKVTSVIRFSLKFNLILSIIFGVILFFSADKIANVIFNDDKLIIAIQIFSIALPFVILSDISVAVIRAFKEAKYVVFIQNIVMNVIRISFFLVFIFFGYVLNGALLAYLIGICLVAAISLYTIQKKMFRFIRPNIKPVPVGKEILIFAWPLALTSYMSLFFLYTDKLILGFFKGPGDVGMYSAVLAIATLVGIIPTALAFNFLPVVSEFCSKKRISELSELYKSVSKWMFSMAFPLCLFIILFNKEIIDLLYGSLYIGASTAFIILSVGISITAFFGLPGNILVGIGKTKLNLLADTIAAISNLVLNILLIPLFGMVGAAIATAIAFGARVTLSTFFVYHSTKIHPFSKRYWKIFPVGLMTIIPIIVIKYFIIDITKWEVIVIFLAYLAFYLFSLAKTNCLDRNDKLIFRSILKKLGFLRRFI